nr:8504_t:CDS:2 [Entrophospora candida]
MSLKLTAFRLLSPTIGGIRGFSQRTFFAFRMNQFVNLQMVKDLEGQGLTRGQANSIMRCMEAVLINSLKIRSELLSKVELENETYHYKAELTDFRIELEVSRKKNQTALMAEIASIQRDVSSLGQKLQDDIANMNSNIQNDINMRKDQN